MGQESREGKGELVLGSSIEGTGKLDALVSRDIRLRQVRKIIGMRLPNLYQKNLITSFSFFVPIQTILEHVNNILQKDPLFCAKNNGKDLKQG